MGALLREGVFFSRWAPHMAHGYGYPLYLYQSPLSAYVAALFNLTGLSWPVAVNGAYLLGLLGSALTAWWLGRALWGEWGGVLTAVSFTFAPYHLYVLFYRASLSEAVAWIFPPLVLWGLLRWQMNRQRRGLATAVFALVALFFTHDVTAYLFLPFFVIWVGGLGTWQRSRRTLWRGGLALGLGIGAGAFFWLPALLERNLIQFGRAGGAWVFRPQNNFLPLDHLFALPRTVDPALLNDWPPRGLGALLALLAVTGVIVGWRRGGRTRWLTAVLALTLAGMLFLVLPLSTFLWQIDLLAAFQFPWRFLAPATLAAALLTGAIFNYQSPTDRLPFTIHHLPFTIMLIALSLLHWGWLFPAHCDAPGDTTLTGMVAWEQSTDTLGTTASGELLPVTVAQMPQESDAPPPWQTRLLPSDLPPGAQILQADYRPLGATIELETPTAFFARYRAFAFPGWQVTINGERHNILPSEPEGLITIPVPNGRSTIEVTFTTTPIRSLGNILTWLCLFFLMITLWRTPPAAPRQQPRRALNTYTAVLIGGVALLLLGVKAIVARQETPLRQTRLEDGTLRAVDTPTAVTFGTPTQPTLIRLLGHDALPTAVAADAPVSVTLYWQALAPISADYRVGLTLLDAEGRRWSDRDLRADRWQRQPPPTTDWPPDRYVRTDFLIDALPGTPPGTYTLQLSLFERESLVPLTLYNTDGTPLGPTLDLGQIAVTAPKRPWTPEDMSPTERLAAAVNDFTLWGSSVDRTEAAPGDPALVTLFWSTETAADAELALVDADGRSAGAWPLTFPAHGPGVWRTQQQLRLPATLTDGRYRWQLTFANDATATWGELSIEAPTRTFTAPSVDINLNETLADRLTLMGATVAETAVAPGDVLDVRLVWRAEQEMTESYRVFVHLTAPDGALVAQSDAEPAKWTRPTTGWLPGEYVTDEHQLQLPAALPPGEYTLSTGIYLPGNGRLATPDGRDTLPITTLTVHSP